MELKDKNGKLIARVDAADPNTQHVDEGVWVTVLGDDGTRPTICLVKMKGESTQNPKEKAPGWYIGFYRDTKAGPNACDFGITLSPDGPIMQVVKDGNVKIANLFDLLERVGL